MIDWIAVKEAADDWEYGKLGKNAFGGGVKQLVMHPSEADVSRLAGMSEDERNAHIDDIVSKSIERLQRKRAEFAVRPYSEAGWGSMFGPIGYLYASRVNNQPWSDREQLKLDQKYDKFTQKYSEKDSEKYREALLKAITKLREKQASKTARDTSPRYTDRLRRNAEFFMEMRNRKGIWDVIDINGNPGKVNGVGLLHN